MGRLQGIIALVLILERSARMAVSLVALALVAALVSGCAATSEAQSNAISQPRASTSPVSQTKSAQNIDPIAPPFTPVMRNGVEPTPSIRAKREPFTKAVTYPDHIAIAILKVTQGVTGGQGVGILPGRPVTTITIHFANDSSKPVNLNEVVVTVVYGIERRLASPVYQDGVADFHDTIAPGKSTVATYSFSIPDTDLGDVTMTVDFDGLHAAATFTGRVK